MSGQTYQFSLLQQIETNAGKPIDPALRRAFMACPRHLFIPRYLQPLTHQWCEIDPEQIEEHLPTLYADRSLGIYQQADSAFVATISQPSLVLQMLSLLDIRSGTTVFEIGTGSGWNAALMGHLVGPQGHVYSMEIFPDLVASSQQAIQQVGVHSVTIVEGDGATGYPPGAPFDRIIFTAGSYDIPLALHHQLKEGGLLLAVLKIAGGGDDLVLLEKRNGVLVSQHASPVMFVPMLGSHRSEWLDGIELTDFLEEKRLSPEPVSCKPFWWGSRLSWNLMQQTEGIRSFLQVSQPGYRVFISRQPQVHYYFGLYDEQSQSLVVAQQDTLISYGNPGAQTQLLDSLSHWVRLGMPGSVRLSLRIYPKTEPRPTEYSGWLLERTDSVFLWELA